VYPQDFDRRFIKVNGVELNVVTGGSGPPLFLLHGFPQTHLIWHRVAPFLARRFRLVIPDLRGYGDSQPPPPDPEHRTYSKREMALDIVALAEHFEFDRFALAGHDRGARVGYRLVLDHPGRVSRFCAIDIIPTLDVWEQMDADKAVSQFHWPFLAVDAPLPERIIGLDPGLFYRAMLERFAGDFARLDVRAVEAYLDQYRDPRKIQAQCEDYRAGATVDRLNDLADREAGHKLDCPVMVLWGKGYLGKKAASPVASWRRWADEVSETALDCGHFIVEEEPGLAQRALGEFFG
jgi:haloacetate dehalogenase